MIYYIEITETLQKTIAIEATGGDTAYHEAKRMYRNAEIFGKGFSVSTLKNAQQFYDLCFSNRKNTINRKKPNIAWPIVSI